MHGLAKIPRRHDLRTYPVRRPFLVTRKPSKSATDFPGLAWFRHKAWLVILSPKESQVATKLGGENISSR